MLRRFFVSSGRRRRPSGPFFSPSGLAAPAALLLTVVLAGCSSEKHDDRKAVFPVRGKLLVDNQPAPGAMIVLHPVNAAAQSERPFGKANPDGTFELTTYEGQDGAPAGEYIVTAEWQFSTDKDAPGPWPNALPPQFADPKRSELKVTIAPGTNDLQPFSLTRR